LFPFTKEGFFAPHPTGSVQRDYTFRSRRGNEAQPRMFASTRHISAAAALQTSERIGALASLELASVQCLRVVVENAMIE
jgi:hypothetical protein